MKTGGIILAGGTGKRMGNTESALPKQFLKISGKPVLAYSIEKFLNITDEIVVVSHPDWLDKTEEIISGRKIPVIPGGAVRQLSVYNGLQYLEGKNISLVAIHDSARPFFTEKLLKNTLDQAEKKGSAIPALPVASTLAFVKDTEIQSYIDRNHTFAIQTPQSFRFDLILEAHSRAFHEEKTDFTDDSQLFEIIGRKADIIEGEETNIKITAKMDLLIAGEMLKAGLAR